MTRIIILCFALIACPLLAQDEPIEQTPSEPPKQIGASESQTKPKEKAQAVNTEPSGPENPIVNDQPARDNANKSDNCTDCDPSVASEIAGLDLIEQRRMADATKDMALYALVGFIPTVFGLFMLGGTLYYTWKIASSTEQTLKQNRAYMVLDPDQIEIITVGGHSSIQAIWRNTGDSPALNVKAYTDWEFFDLEDEVFGNIPVFENKNVDAEYGTVIGSNMTYSPAFPKIFHQPKKVIAFHAVCLYSDIHGRNYKHQMTGIGALQGKKFGVQFGYGKQNGEEETTT